MGWTEITFGSGRGRQVAGVRVRSALLVSIVTAIVVIVGLVGSGIFASSVSGSAISGSAGLAPASSGLDCNGAGNPSPSALYVNLYEPTAPLASGGRITATMEFEVQNYTSSDTGISVVFPTVDFTFPLSPTGNFTILLSPQTLTIAGSGWTTGAHTNRSAIEAAGLQFLSGGKVRMSTQKVAIQANVPYGQLTLEFRWMWNITQPNGSALKSPWSTPTAKWGGGAVLPSIFFPAQ